MLTAWMAPLLAAVFNPHAAVPGSRAAIVLKAPTACEAVRRSDVEKSLGREVGPAAEEKSAGASTCDYGAGGGRVTISVQHVAENLNIAAELESMRAVFPNATFREVPGLGKRAVLLELDSSGAQMHVVLGEHDYVMVSVLGFGDAARVSGAVTELARKAAGRFF